MKYLLLKFKYLERIFVIERLKGGSVSNTFTIEDYRILYPKNVSKIIKNEIDYRVKSNSQGGRIFNKKEACEDLRCIFKRLFEYEHEYIK